MSVEAGPNIVYNGLILNIDAGNSKSYSGSGTSVINLSDNSTTYTSQAGVSYNSSNNGYFSFNGSSTGAIPLQTFTGLGLIDRTINMWIKLLTQSGGGSKRIFSLTATQSTGADTPAFTAAIETTGIGFGCGGSPYDGYGGISAAFNVWHNVCFTIVGKTTSAYLNGVFQLSKTSTGEVAINPYGFIGKYNDFYGQNATFDGSVFQIYNRALSVTEIQQNYNSLKGRYGL
jgi:hypothetical protein